MTMPSSDVAVLCRSYLPSPPSGTEPVRQHTADVLEQGRSCSTALPTPTTQVSTGCLLFALYKGKLGTLSSSVKYRELYEDHKGLLG